MAFPTKKLISLLIAIVSALTPVIYSLVNNSFSDLKVSLYLHPMESSINSFPFRRRENSRDYVDALQAKIEKELFGESRRKGRSRREVEALRPYSLNLEKPIKLGRDAKCKLVDTERNKKMFKCTGPKKGKGPLSSMIFKFTK